MLSHLKRLRTAAAVSLFLSASIGASAAYAESYTYDAQGRLTSFTSNSGAVTYYCYDAAGNRTYVGPTSC
jgi:YD repeat-containing protein